MRTIYYYMPPCPKCGSEATGRYMLQPFVNKHYTMTESLKNGELIRFAKKIPNKNAFCEDCGFEWHEDPRLVYITKEEKEDEKSRRHTDKKLNQYLKDNNLDTNKKKFLGGMFDGLIHFF